MESAGSAGVATCRSNFGTKPGSRRTRNRAFICLTSDELGPLIMEIPHRRPTATRSLSGKNTMPLPGGDLFLGGRFIRISFFVEEPGDERESRASALSLSLSLSLLRDDTAIRCEEQLIEH